MPAVAAEVTGLTGEDLLAVQTVLVEPHRAELQAGLAAAGLAPFHVLLDCDEDRLRQRIESDALDPGARGWRLDHVRPYLAARSWMVDAADLVVDVTDRGVDDAARAILHAAGTDRN